MMLRRATVSDAMDIATVKIDSWRTAYKGIVSDTLLGALEPGDVSRNWLAVSPEELPAHGLVATRGGCAEAYTLFGAPHDCPAGWDCQLYEIYVRSASFRTGLGHALFRETMSLLCEAGHTAMAL